MQEKVFNINQSLLQRFWKYVKRGPADACWEWRGYILNNGRGQIRGHQGKCWQAHRLSWVIHNGAIPDGLLVCHHCDNPICVNPAHLFLGTHKDNSQDAAKKYRMIGPRQLSLEQIMQVREMYDNSDKKQKEIAKLFGVSYGVIHYTVSHKSRALPDLRCKRTKDRAIAVEPKKEPWYIPDNIY